MEQCKSSDFNRLVEFYKYVTEETEGMYEYCRWIYGRHPSDEMIRDFLERGEMYFEEDGDNIVAATAMTLYQPETYREVNWQLDLKDDEAAVVHILAIDPRLQHTGKGKAVMKELFDIARSEGKKALRLDVLDTNIPAQKLYSSLGFRDCGTYNWYVANLGYTDFYLLEYIL